MTVTLNYVFTVHVNIFLCNELWLAGIYGNMQISTSSDERETGNEAIVEPMLSL